MATVNVLTAAKTLELLGFSIVGAQVVGDNLIFTTKSGQTINAGNVRGSAAVNPTSTLTAFSPTNGIAASNVQAAIVELGGDVTTLTTNKATTAEVIKIASGRLLQPATAYTNVRKYWTNILPASYFTTPPRVLLNVDSTAPENTYEFTVYDVTLRSFGLTSHTINDTDRNYHWMAIGT